MTDPSIPLRRLRDSLADRFDTEAVDELFAVGEWHDGFELLGDQVYEADRALTAEELRLVDEAAAAWQDPPYRRAAKFAAACLHAAGPRGADGRWPVRLLTVAYFRGDQLRDSLRQALDLPDCKMDAWRRMPVTAPQLPHVLEVHHWDVLRRVDPEDARGMLEWLLAASASGDFNFTISDSDDRPVDPREELRRLSSARGV